MSDIAIDPPRSPFASLRGDLRRNARMMLAAFLGTIALFGGAALLKPPNYRAESVLLVRLGAEYLVNGDPAATNLYTEPVDIVASEAGIMQTPELAQEVINKVGIGRVYPSIADDIDPADPDTATDAMERAIIRFKRELGILPVKDTTLVDVTFTNHDAQVASDVLRTTVETYLQHRRKVFRYGLGRDMGSQVQLTLDVLHQRTEELQAIKQTYGITDIDKQYTLLFNEKEDLTRSANTARLDIAAQSGQIAVLEPLVATPELVLTETVSHSGPAVLDVRDSIAKLHIQRAALLLTFKPGTPQIDDIDKQIRMNEQLLHVYAADQDMSFTKELLPHHNFAIQELQSARAQMEASTRSLALAESRIADTAAAINRIDGARLSFDQKTQEVQAAQDAYAQAAKRMSEARAHDQMLQESRPNVEIVQAARPPYKETPVRLIIAGAGVVLGLLLAGTIFYLDNLSRAWRTQS